MSDGTCHCRRLAGQFSYTVAHRVGGHFGSKIFDLHSKWRRARRQSPATRPDSFVSSSRSLFAFVSFRIFCLRFSARRNFQSEARSKRRRQRKSSSRLNADFELILFEYCLFDATPLRLLLFELKDPLPRDLLRLRGPTSAEGLLWTATVCATPTSCGTCASATGRQQCCGRLSPSCRQACRRRSRALYSMSACSAPRSVAQSHCRAP